MCYEGFGCPSEEAFDSGAVILGHLPLPAGLIRFLG